MLLYVFFFIEKYEISFYNFFFICFIFKNMFFKFPRNDKLTIVSFIRKVLNELESLAKTQQDSAFLIMQALANMIQSLIQTLAEVEPRFTMAAFGLANLLGNKLIKESFEQVSRFDRENPFLKIEEHLSEEALETAQKCLIKFIETKRRMLSDLRLSSEISVNSSGIGF